MKLPSADADWYVVPFEGWEPINEGRAGIGQIAPALRDLNARLEKLEKAFEDYSRSQAWVAIGRADK